jgi:hypothetical protein
LRRTARDARQRDHAIVYDDADLRPGHGGAFKDCIDMRVSVVNVPSIGGRTLELDVRRK